MDSPVLRAVVKTHKKVGEDGRSEDRLEEKAAMGSVAGKLPMDLRAGKHIGVGQPIVRVRT